MGLIDKAGKKVLLGLPDKKLISLARESMPYISVQADGLSFIFKNTDHSILDNMVEQKKVWSRDEMDYILGYFERHSSRPAAVIDIGANVGTSIIYFRDRLGSSCSYYAIEPVEENYNLLNANCAINGFEDITTIRCGVSETSCKAKMEIDPDSMATCRVAGSDDTGLVYSGNGRSSLSEDIPFITIDDFAAGHGIGTASPLIFWIDVEGHEPEVFRGGKKTFANTDSCVFCEFNPKLYKYNGRYDGFMEDIKECFSGFICYEQSAPGEYLFRNIDEIDRIADENNMEQCNLFLVKQRN